MGAGEIICKVANAAEPAHNFPPAQVRTRGRRLDNCKTMEFGNQAAAAAGPRERLQLRGVLSGHNGWVTALATTATDENVLVSGSRDKSLIKWDLSAKDAQSYGVPVKRMTGHAHFISDVVISSDGQFGLSGSWDGTLRLWELATGKTQKRFVNHKKDVLSVAFSPDNRQIVSGSRDHTINLWNTLGQSKFEFEADGHSDWVSCVRFSPNIEAPTMVSAGWDRVVKVWDLSNLTLKTTLKGHTGYINSVSVSPDGSLCASGGKDGVAMLWDLIDGRPLSSLEAGGVINALAFSPNRYWLCAATEHCIKTWNLESKKCFEDITIEQPFRSKKFVPIQCVSLCWSADGTTLFAGYTDNKIRVYAVGQ